MGATVKCYDIPKEQLIHLESDKIYTFKYDELEGEKVKMLIFDDEHNL